MALNIDKRTRALTTDPWGQWVSTTDAPPYTNTTIVEYRVSNDYVTNGSVLIDSSNLTNGSVQQDADGNYYWTGTGIFDTLMEAVNSNIKIEYDNGRITGGAYASTYLGALQAVIAESNRYVLSKRQAEENIAKLKIANYSADATKDDKVATSTSALNVTQGTEPYKILLSQYQSDKGLADVNMTIAQQKALEEQVIDNRYIKAIDSLARTYGTFGAGGLTVSGDQWNKYYTLISQLIEDLRDYKGDWDATTVFPGPVDGVTGDFWVVSVDGSQVVDGITPWVVGDIVYYDGAKWTKMAATPANTTVARVV